MAVEMSNPHTQAEQRAGLTAQPWLLPRTLQSLASEPLCASLRHKMWDPQEALPQGAASAAQQVPLASSSSMVVLVLSEDS